MKTKLSQIAIFAQLLWISVSKGNWKFEGKCEKKAEFTAKGRGSALTGHVLATIYVDDRIDCSLECLANKCSSFNYKLNNQPPHLCELNTKTMAATADLVGKSGYDYFDANNYVSACSSSPCLNGGTCSSCCEQNYFAYDCTCRPGFVGVNCHTWEGSDGSSSDSPGRSCLQIKYFGLSRGDGRYWIRPSLAKNAFTVYCDMTTDGGGWTVLKNITLTRTTNLPSNDGITDYTKITNLPWSDILETPGLNSLRDDMGFDQIRYFCRKKAVGRTFHIMINKNEQGNAALADLMFEPVPTPGHPKACGSFTRLPDDNSQLSANCAKWGFVNGVVKSDRVGHSGNRGQYRTYRRVGFWAKSGGSITVGFVISDLWCDDYSTSNRRVGDFFIMFVR